MKKLLMAFVLLSTVSLLSGCTIDWHDAKDAKIKELEAQLQNQNFDKDVKCQWLAESFKRQYNNIHSLYYNKDYDICYIKYFDPKNKKDILEGPINDFWRNK